MQRRSAPTSWPPQVEIAAVGDGLDMALVGTITRADGTVQATYNGWPLYYFGGDSAAGDVNGQGVNDVWWVIDASGTPIGDLIERSPRRSQTASGQGLLPAPMEDPDRSVPPTRPNRSYRRVDTWVTSR